MRLGYIKPKRTPLNFRLFNSTKSDFNLTLNDNIIISIDASKDSLPLLSKNIVGFGIKDYEYSENRSTHSISKYTKSTIQNNTEDSLFIMINKSYDGYGSDVGLEILYSRMADFYKASEIPTPRIIEIPPSQSREIDLCATIHSTHTDNLVSIYSGGKWSYPDISDREIW